MRTVRQILIGASIALVLAACGGSKAPTEAQVVLSEWAIEPQELTVQAGSVTFEVQNAGSIEHNFVIKGVEQGLELLLPADTQTLTVTLTPGTYSMVCSLPGHTEAGMTSALTVSD